MIVGQTDISKKVYVIAEVGGNHNGDPETAYELVRVAARSGASAVKFQTYRAETLVHPSVEPVPLVKKYFRTQLDRFKSLELPWNVYEKIMALCKELGIDFLTTPFDIEILKRVYPSMPAIKVASGDLTYHMLIQAAVETGLPIILSTGMSTIEEIERAANLVPADRLILLHCVSIYPLPDEQAQLRAITAMQQCWPNIPIGYSDHTRGATACLAAVALGARVIEKHFTLDTSQSPGDHVLSLDEQGMTDMVSQVRRIECLLGEPVKRPASGEIDMRKRMRRGLYAAHDLSAGRVLSLDDVLCIRPETSMSADRLGELTGRTLKRGVSGFEPLADDLIVAEPSR